MGSWDVISTSWYKQGSAKFPWVTQLLFPNQTYRPGPGSCLNERGPLSTLRKAPEHRVHRLPIGRNGPVTIHFRLIFAVVGRVPISFLVCGRLTQFVFGNIQFIATKIRVVIEFLPR